MSTESIRHALEALKRYAHAADHDGDWNTAVAAKDELEAIEKAAGTVALVGHSERRPFQYTEWVEARALFISIAAQRNAGTAGADGPKDGASGPQE